MFFDDSRSGNTLIEEDIHSVAAPSTAFLDECLPVVSERERKFEDELYLVRVAVSPFGSFSEAPLQSLYPLLIGLSNRPQGIRILTGDCCRLGAKRGHVDWR